MGIAAISVVVAAASVVAASTFYGFQVRNQIRLRRTDLLVRLYSTWDTLQFQEAFHTIYWAEFSDLDSMVAAIGGRPVATYVFTFYDEIGVLLKPGVDRLRPRRRSHRTLSAADVGEGRAEPRRGTCALDPTLYVNFEFLYSEMREHSAFTSPRAGDQR